MRAARSSGSIAVASAQLTLATKAASRNSRLSKKPLNDLKALLGDRRPELRMRELEVLVAVVVDEVEQDLRLGEVGDPRCADIVLDRLAIDLADVEEIFDRVHRQHGARRVPKDAAELQGMAFAALRAVKDRATIRQEQLDALDILDGVFRRLIGLDRGEDGARPRRVERGPRIGGN